jgi:hypothetical protein
VTIPAWLVLASSLALGLALVYQIASRRFGWRVLAYWLVIFAGFLAMEMVAESFGWNLTRFGDLRLAPDLGGAFFVIGLLWFLGI